MVSAFTAAAAFAVAVAVSDWPNVLFVFCAVLYFQSRSLSPLSLPSCVGTFLMAHSLTLLFVFFLLDLLLCCWLGRLDGLIAQKEAKSREFLECTLRVWRASYSLTVEYRGQQ